MASSDPVCGERECNNTMCKTCLMILETKKKRLITRIPKTKNKIKNKNKKTKTSAMDGHLYAMLGMPLGDHSFYLRERRPIPLV